MTYNYKGSNANRQSYVYNTQDAAVRFRLNADRLNTAFGSANWELYVEGCANCNQAASSIFGKITNDNGAISPGAGTSLGIASAALTNNGTDWANYLSGFQMGPFNTDLPTTGINACTLALRTDVASSTGYYADVTIIAVKKS